jgi:hypothetical protein
MVNFPLHKKNLKPPRLKGEKKLFVKEQREKKKLNKKRK